MLISTLTHNPQPMHLDHRARRRTASSARPLVNSCFTFSLMVGVSVGDTTLGTLVANLGYDEVRFPQAGIRRRYAALRERGASRVRESKSRPNAGIVTWEHRSFNQRGELVCTCSAPRCSTRSRHDAASAAQLAVRPRGQQQEDDEGAGQRRPTR